MLSSLGPLYSWFILPLLIFIARILDVSMGTVRVIFVSRGMKYLAPVMGFFEVLIWLLAIGQIIKKPIQSALLHCLRRRFLRWAIS